MRWRGSLLLLGAATAFAASRVELVKDGRSSYSICVSNEASPSEKRAAGELQRFLRDMSGATLPIVADQDRPRGNLVLVGRSAALDRLKLGIPFDSLGAEGYVLKTAGRHLIIAGGRQRGAMYGVYGFLDRLGCRWFTPEVSRIPKQPTIIVEPLDERQKPAFEYREPFFTEAADTDWAARNRVNGQSQRLDEPAGGKLQYYPFVHSFYQMVPPQKYFKDHPEYFSLIDGKRRWERGQLCLTNPEVLRLGVQVVRGWIRAHPEATIFSVSQNDWTGWCECDNCRRVEEEEGGVHSGPVLRYVNQLAAEIEKEHPDKLIDTLAYWYTERAPSQTKPRRNVRIRLCPIGACVAHPFDECPYNTFFVNILKDWSKITGQLYIWHYNTDFAHYLLPFPDFDELAADIPMYRRNGVVGLFLEGAYAPGGGGENAELRSYMMARLLWNPSLDAGREVNDFLEAYYGQAAGPMRAYFDLAHQQVRPSPAGRGKHLWIYVNPLSPHINREFLDRAAELFRKAGAAADTDAVRRRVARARLSIDYVELIRSKAFLARGDVYAPDNLDGLKSRFQEFMKRTREFGIQQLHEGRALKLDEEEFAASIRSYRTVTLENAAVRVAVVPGWGGRIIQLTDKKTGVNVLRAPDPGERGYPNLGGAWISLSPDYYAAATGVKWGMEPDAGNAVILYGLAANGLRLTRRIALRGDEPVVHTVTEVENGEKEPVNAALQARAEFSAGDVDGTGLALRYKARDGTVVDSPLFQPGQETTGNEMLKEAKVPDGSWTAWHRELPLGLVNAFRNNQVVRSNMTWTLRGDNRVTLGLWTAEKSLAPGEKMVLEADYAVGRQ